MYMSTRSRDDCNNNCNVACISVKWNHHGAMRRFQLTKLDWTFEKLMQTIREFEPDFNDTLTYTDNEGDQIDFSTTREMKELLFISRNINPRATVKINSSELKRDPLSRSVHQNIICDSCDKDLCGIRYKCVICDDFDLCERCERTGTHSHHVMLRLVRPDTPICGLFYGGGAVSRRHTRHQERRELRQAMREFANEASFQGKSQMTEIYKQRQKCRLDSKKHAQKSNSQMSSASASQTSSTPVTEKAHEFDAKSTGMEQRIKNFGTQLQMALMNMGVEREIAVEEEERAGLVIERTKANAPPSSAANTTPAEPVKPVAHQEAAGIHQILTNADRDTKLTIKRKLEEGQNGAAAKTSKSSSMSTTINTAATAFSNPAPNASQQDEEQPIQRGPMASVWDVLMRNSTDEMNRLLTERVYSSAVEFESLISPLVTGLQQKLDLTSLLPSASSTRSTISQPHPKSQETNTESSGMQPQTKSESQSQSQPQLQQQMQPRGQTLEQQALQTQQPPLEQRNQIWLEERNEEKKQPQQDLNMKWGINTGFNGDRVNPMLVISEPFNQKVYAADTTTADTLILERASDNNSSNEEHNNSNSSNKDDNNEKQPIVTDNDINSNNANINNNINEINNNSENNDSVVGEIIEFVEIDVDAVGSAEEHSLTQELNDNANTSLSSFSSVGSSSANSLSGNDDDDEWMIVKKTSYKTLCDFYEQRRREQLQDGVDIDSLELRDVRVVPNLHVKSSANNAITSTDCEFRTLVNDMINTLAIKYPNLNIDDNYDKNRHKNDSDKDNSDNNNDNNNKNNNNNNIICNNHKISGEKVDSVDINDKETVEVNHALANLSLQPSTSVMQNEINLKRQEIGQSLFNVKTDSSKCVGASPLWSSLQLPQSNNNDAFVDSIGNINNINDNTNDANSSMKEMETPEEEHCYAGVPYYPTRRPHNKKCYIRHPHPVVQKAVDRLEAMGYDNCNGWLTGLAERYRGDIVDVLDAAEKDHLHQARLAADR